MINLTNEQILDKGNNAIIYDIGNNQVAKILRYYRLKRDLVERTLEREFSIGRLAFDKGISCPEFFGVNEFLTPPSKDYYDKPEGDTKRLGLVMSKINGRTIEDFYEKEILDKDNPQIHLYYKAIDNLDSELEKARKLGFIPFDANLKNAILTPERKVVLIDLYNWEYKGN